MSGAEQRRPSNQNELTIYILVVACGQYYNERTCQNFLAPYSLEVVPDSNSGLHPSSI